MHDAKLDELLADLICAAEDATEGNEWAREARAALVAHVREREVELMALAISSFADEDKGAVPGNANALRRWRDLVGQRPDLAEAVIARARALRDAYDQAGGKGATS